MITKGLMSSKTYEWETPKDLFEYYNSVYHFDLDVCATKENAKCDKYFTIEQDGLKQDWYGNVWCNPPYGKEIIKWVRKASKYKGLCVMLLPARTDTKWFHWYVLHCARIEFIFGRLHFNNSKTSAPFPSIIAIYNEEKWKYGY